MFIYGVDGKGACGIRGGGQYVGFGTQAHDVGCVSTTSAFGVIGVNGAAFEGN